MKFKNIIFDLDGTLTKSDEGIFYTLEKVFKKVNATPPSKTEWLSRFIGPSLHDIYLSVGIDIKDVNFAIKLYQDIYAKEGMFLSTLYDGILDLLTSLKNSGCNIYMATAKNVSAGIDVAKHLKIIDFFKHIEGSSDDQTVSEKPKIIENLLKKTNILDTDSTVMIGDKKYDIDGAIANNIKSIGVTYGYGNIEELKSASYIVNTVDELKKLLLK